MVWIRASFQVLLGLAIASGLGFSNRSYIVRSFIVPYIVWWGHIVGRWLFDCVGQKEGFHSIETSTHCC